MIAGALIGSQATAVCTVIVLPQCVRKRNENATPRAEQRGWAVACFALTVALAAQISGGAARVRSLEFRVTELGGGIALLALVVAAAFAAAHQRAGRYASSRPGGRAVMLAAGAVVVLAAGMGMIVSRSPGTRPGQAFPWLCLLAAALATVASLVTREQMLAAAYARDDRLGGGAAPARRAWAESRDAWDDWDRPLSGDRASAHRNEEDPWDAPAGHGSGADEDGRVGQDSLAASDAPASRDPGADWDPPIRADAPAEAAQADPGPPVHQDHPAEADHPAQAEPADGDASAGEEPQASDEDDEDASDWFRPARKRAPVDRDEEDIESAASWEAPSSWFRPAVDPAGDSRDTSANSGGQPEVADEPDLSRSPD